MFDILQAGRKAILRDRFGRIINNNSNVVADGQTVSVGMMMQDAAGNVVPHPVHAVQVSPEAVALEAEQQAQRAELNSRVAREMKKASLSNAWRGDELNKNDWW